MNKKRNSRITLKNLQHETLVESSETIHKTIKASLELIYNQDLNYPDVCDFIPVNPFSENEQ